MCNVQIKQGGCKLFVWMALFSKVLDMAMCEIGLGKFPPKDILSLFKSWSFLKKKSMYLCIWLIIPSILIWEIWKAWNKRVLQSKEINISSFQNKVETTIVEIVNNKVLRLNPQKVEFTEWDVKLRLGWFDLNILKFGNKKVERERVLCAKAIWKPLLSHGINWTLMRHQEEIHEGWVWTT